MSQPRESRKIALRLILGLAAAAGLRLWALVALSGDWRINDPVMDGLHYLSLATRLAQGGGWPPGPIFMTPLYPFLLSLVFRWATPGVLTVQICQTLLGGATGLLLWQAARRDLGPRAAWALAGLYLFCAPVLEMESEVLTECLLLFLTAAALRAWPFPGKPWWRYLLFGIIGGALTIGRGVFVFLPLAAAAWMFLHRSAGKVTVRTDRTRLRAAVLLAAGFVLALLPVSIYQTQTTGRLELLSLNGGLNLYLGNNPAARGIYSAPPEIDLESDFSAAHSASLLAGRNLDLAESDRFWRERSLQFMRAQPGRFLWLLGRKALLFLSPREIPQLQDFQEQRRDWLPLRLAFVDFGWILPLALLGVVGGRRRRSSGAAARGETGRPGGGEAGGTRGDAGGPGRDGAGRRRDEEAPRLAPWLILVAVGWISTIAFFATGRYRIPFYPGFLGPAALGLLAVGEMIRHRKAEWAAGLIPLVVATQWLLPGYPVDRARAHDDFQHGGYLIRHHQAADALSAYRAGTEAAPEDGACWHGCGVALVQLGRLPEAATAYETACRLLPNSALTHYDLGSVYGRLGQDARALSEFQAAARLDPFDPRFASDLAVALARTGRRQEAIDTLREVLRRHPEYLPARQSLQALGGR